MVFGFPLSRKLDLSRKVWFSAMYFQHKVFRQCSVQISLITQKFSASFFKNIKRKNRGEVFGVSSENILHLTSRGFMQWRFPAHGTSQIYRKELKKNVTFYCKVWFSAFHCHANLVFLAKLGFTQRIFNTKFFDKVRFRFYLSRKIFRLHF